jgi:hypothetical protein
LGRPGGGARDANFLIREAHHLARVQLAADACFGLAIHGHGAPGDQRLGSAAGRRQAQQLEEDVKFNEVALKLEAMNGQEILRSGGL